MTALEIATRIGEMCTLFGFEIDGKAGNVDPCYIPGKGNEFLLFFDGKEQTVYTVDDVMNTPFIGGKALNEIAEKLTITEM